MNLMHHQEQVLKATEQYGSAGYFLDMGLGKTFVGSEKMKQIGNTVNLVICQKSKVKDWMDHFRTYYPEYTLYDATSHLKADRQSYEEGFWNSYRNDSICPSIIFINYELAWRRPELLKLKDFTLILDESSLIQNLKAKQTKYVMKLKPANVILLSGTPSSGKYENLVSQCQLLGWNISEHTYNSQYVNWTTIKVSGMKIRTVDKDDPYKNVERLKRKLSEHGAIFMKTEEVMDLPEQIDIPVLLERSKEYKQFTRDLILDIDGETLVGDTILTKRLYQRMLCGQYSKDKLQAFTDLINSTNDRLIVFYNFNEELHRLGAICTNEGKLVGVINGERKDEITDQDVLLVQYQAGSMGLNLQDFGNKIIYFTLPERSELFEQSKKRIHRIGQNDTCFYYYMLVTDSIETEEILPTLKIRKEWTDELFT